MRFFKDFRMLIGWLHHIMQVGFRNKVIVDENKSFLRAGKYKNSLRGDYIFEKNSRSYLGDKTFSSLTHFNRYLDPILLACARVFTYKVKANEVKNFNGSELIVSSGETEIKIFDKESRTVLTTYKSIDKLEQVSSNKDFFGRYYNVSKTLKIDKDNGYIIEEFIPHVDFDVYSSLLFFLDKQIEYLYDVKKQVCCDAELDKQLVMQFATYSGYSKLLEKVKDIPRVVSHGDFWRSNIIYDGEHYYLTDFERKGERFFLYDFLCFIFSDSLLLKNNRLIDAYFAGEFDFILAKVFKAIGKEYNKNSKDVYFLTFLVEISCERWKSKTNDYISEFINKYIPNYYK